jgi:hypothetical protein
MVQNPQPRNMQRLPQIGSAWNGPNTCAFTPMQVLKTNAQKSPASP